MAKATATAPAPALPPALTQALLDDRRAIAHRLARRLASEIALPPEFRRPSYLRSVVAASRDGLEALLRQLHDGRPPHAAQLERLGLAGARQAELGVPLEVLLSGYRLAAKVVWRDVIDRATRTGELPPGTVVALSEQVLEYLDTVSAAVGAAYLETRERLVRQRDRDRDRVLQRLVDGEASAELRRLAAGLDLELAPPYRVLAASAPPGVDLDRGGGPVWRRAGALAVAREAGLWVILVPPAVVPATLAAELTAGLRATAAGLPAVRLAVGPVVHDLAAVAAAATLAGRALAAGSRLNPEATVHDGGELGVYAALLGDPTALAAHVQAVLGPLLGRRRRAAELRRTLEVVVDTGGAAAAATVLGLHRHTVVYRLERAAALLGRDLSSPAERHRVWLALRCLRLLEEDPTAR